MPSSRVSAIIDEWRAVTSAARLPPRAPRPSRVGLQVGLLATVFALGVLLVALARATDGNLPTSTEGGASATPTTPGVAVASASPTAPVPATPSLPASPSLPALGGGTCNGSQLVLGEATNSWFYTSAGTAKNGVSQPYRNSSEACVLVLPATILVAPATGSFEAVSVSIVGSEKSFSIKSGQSGSIELTATWLVGDGIPGQTAKPCAHFVQYVTRLEIPVASGTLPIDIGTVWDAVCSSPASVTISLKP